MAMRLELARLASLHGVAHRPHIIALSPPTAGPMTLTGLASTIDVDLTRQKFRGWAFTNPCLLMSGFPRPPLLYKHDPEQVAGVITHLDFDDRGQLRIDADVTHELARRCNAFSVCASILQYEICIADSADYFALITKAQIDEISLTDRPANPNALVRSRYRTPPMTAYLNTLGETNALLVRGVGVIQQMVQVIQQSYCADHPPQPPRDRQTRVQTGPEFRSAGKPKSEFARLVEEMNHHAHP